MKIKAWAVVSKKYKTIVQTITGGEGIYNTLKRAEKTVNSNKDIFKIVPCYIVLPGKAVK